MVAKAVPILLDLTKRFKVCSQARLFEEAITSTGVRIPVERGMPVAARRLGTARPMGPRPDGPQLDDISDLIRDPVSIKGYPSLNCNLFYGYICDPLRDKF